MEKDVEYYMSLPYRMELIEDSDEGGYCIKFPELPGCLSCAGSFEDVAHMADDAKRTWIEATLEMGQEVPEPSELEDYSGQFKLRIPKSLHKSLAEHAKREGISMNQYCVYLLSYRDAALNARHPVSLAAREAAHDILAIDEMAEA